MPCYNQTTNAMERKYLILLGMLLINLSAHAGSEFYLGADIVGHQLNTSTTTQINQTPALPSTTTTFGDANEDSLNIGIRTGYKFKSRLTDRYYWAPEFSLVTFDKSILYSTNLKFGYEFAPYEIYTTLGISRVEKFTDNRLNLALGFEYRLTNQSSINVELTSYDIINENTSSTSVIGANVMTINTDTTRKINSLRIGFTYYFQGSI